VIALRFQAGGGGEQGYGGLCIDDACRRTWWSACYRGLKVTQLLRKLPQKIEFGNGTAQNLVKLSEIEIVSVAPTKPVQRSVVVLR
jgi:hypothetical protein